jgi:Zn-dependent protease
MDELSTLQRLAVLALPVLFAITFHEIAHGWVALKLGDPTAKMLGRLSPNPLKHIDPIGTVLVPILLFLSSGFLFGWAKPVPITWENLKHPRRDMALVAVAGPLTNLLMAVLWALVVKFAIMADPAGASGIAKFFMYSGMAGIFINIILCVLNLLPLPPLDGGRVLVGVLPGPMAWQVSRIEPYGFIILVLLLMTGILGRILSPIVSYLQSIIFQIV